LKIFGFTPTQNNTQVSCLDKDLIEVLNLNPSLDRQQPKTLERSLLRIRVSRGSRIMQLSADNFEFFYQKKKNYIFIVETIHPLRTKKKNYTYLCVVVLLSAPISCCLCGWGTRVAATIGVVDRRGTIRKFNKIEKVQN